MGGSPSWVVDAAYEAYEPVLSEETADSGSSVRGRWARLMAGVWLIEPKDEVLSMAASHAYGDEDEALRREKMPMVCELLEWQTVERMAARLLSLAISCILYHVEVSRRPPVPDDSRRWQKCGDPTYATQARGLATTWCSVAAGLMLTTARRGERQRQDTESRRSAEQQEPHSFWGVDVRNGRVSVRVQVRWANVLRPLVSHPHASLLIPLFSPTPSHSLSWRQRGRRKAHEARGFGALRTKRRQRVQISTWANHLALPGGRRLNPAGSTCIVFCFADAMSALPGSMGQRASCARHSKGRRGVPAQVVRARAR